MQEVAPQARQNWMGSAAAGAYIPVANLFRATRVKMSTAVTAAAAGMTAAAVVERSTAVVSQLTVPEGAATLYRPGAEGVAGLSFRSAKSA